MTQANVTQVNSNEATNQSTDKDANQSANQDAVAISNIRTDSDSSKLWKWMGSTIVAGVVVLLGWIFYAFRKNDDKPGSPSETVDKSSDDNKDSTRKNDDKPGSPSAPEDKFADDNKNIPSKNDQYQSTELDNKVIKACSGLNFIELNQLINKGADLCAPGINGATAIEYGDLLFPGADYKKKKNFLEYIVDQFGFDPFGNDIDVAKILYELYFKDDLASPTGRQDNKLTFELFLSRYDKKGLLKNPVREKEEETELDESCEKAHEDIYSNDTQNNTCAETSYHFKNDSTAKNAKLLAEAFKSRNTETIKYYLNNNVDPFIPVEDSIAPINYGNIMPKDKDFQASEEGAKIMVILLKFFGMRPIIDRGIKFNELVSAYKEVGNFESDAKESYKLYLTSLQNPKTSPRINGENLFQEQSISPEDPLKINGGGAFEERSNDDDSVVL